MTSGTQRTRPIPRASSTPPASKGSENNLKKPAKLNRHEQERFHKAPPNRKNIPANQKTLSDFINPDNERLPAKLKNLPMIADNSIRPYAFQERTIEALRNSKRRDRDLEHWNSSSSPDASEILADLKSSLIIAPPGAGKTMMFVNDLLNTLINNNKKLKTNSSVLVLAHRDLLLQQILQTIAYLCPAELKKELLNKIRIVDSLEALKQITKEDDTKIFLVSTNTLVTAQSRGKGALINKLPFDTLKHIVIDEAHHYVAKSYYPLVLSIIQKIKTAQPNLHIKLVGATATPRRHTRSVNKRVDLSDLFPRNNRIIATTLTQMLRLKLLKLPKGIKLETNLSDNLEISKHTGDYQSASVESTIANPQLTKTLVNIYNQEFVAVGNKKRVLVFGATKKHAKQLVQAFSENGKRNAACILDDEAFLIKTKKRVNMPREELLNNFGSTGKNSYDVLVNCDVLAEGVDLPQTQGVIFASLTRSLPKFTQVLGRALRKHPENNDTLFLYLSPQRYPQRNPMEFANLGFQNKQILSVEETEDGATQHSVLETNNIRNIDDLLIDHRHNSNDSRQAEWQEILLAKLRDKYQINEGNFQELLNIFIEEYQTRHSTALDEDELQLIAKGEEQCISTDLLTRQKIFRDLMNLAGFKAREILALKSRFITMIGFEDFQELKTYVKNDEESNLKQLLNSLNDIDQKLSEIKPWQRHDEYNKNKWDSLHSQLSEKLNDYMNYCKSLGLDKLSLVKLYAGEDSSKLCTNVRGLINASLGARDNNAVDCNFDNFQDFLWALPDETQIKLKTDIEQLISRSEKIVATISIRNIFDFSTQIAKEIIGDEKLSFRFTRGFFGEEAWDAACSLGFESIDKIIKSPSIDSVLSKDCKLINSALKDKLITSRIIPCNPESWLGALITALSKKCGQEITVDNFLGAAKKYAKELAKKHNSIESDILKLLILDSGLFDSDSDRYKKLFKSITKELGINTKALENSLPNYVLDKPVDLHELIDTVDPTKESAIRNSLARQGNATFFQLVPMRIIKESQMYGQRRLDPSIVNTYRQTHITRSLAETMIRPFIKDMIVKAVQAA